MPSGNTVTIWGHVGKDPMGKKTAKGDTLINFSVANKRGENTDWFDITKWEPTEWDLKIRKGDLVLLQGRMQQDTWEKEGQKRSAIKVVAYRIDMMKSKEFAPTQTEMPTGAPGGPDPFHGNLSIISPYEDSLPF